MNNAEAVLVPLQIATARAFTHEQQSGENIEVVINCQCYSDIAGNHSLLGT